MTGRWVVLEPLDTVTIRDGRAFDMGQDAVAHMALPTPATFAGAIGAAYDPEPGLARKDPAIRGVRLPSQVHGPIMVRRNADQAGQWDALLPVPRDVVVTKGNEPRRLAADHQLAGIQHDIDNEVAMLLTEPATDTVPAEGHWWDADQLGCYLRDGELSGYWVSEPWHVERRVGLAREDDRTVTEGMFYSIEHLRLEPGVGFAGRCIGGPDRQLDGTIPFGGQGRCAEVHGEVPAIGLPDVPGQFPGGRLLLYLATPAVFPGGSWRPDLGPWIAEWGETRLLAAAVGTPQVIATGTANRRSGSFGAGRLMWAVPAGAVYYLQLRDADAASAAAARVHGATLPQADGWMTTAGFGLVLTGRWTEG
jgi:CRISPR-associated protein Cmr3